MKRAYFFGAFLLQLLVLTATAQFAPQAGITGSTAIAKDDNSIVEWATGCVLQRSWQHIADTSLGRTTVGDENSALGKAGESGVVSLGDGGAATLSFLHAVTNGPGFDFAIFENGFPAGGSGMAFLEFAFVEVSSDGNTFVRFPPVSHIQDTVQMAMAGVDCALVNNLAGKYINGYGTPFDLEELKNEPGLDVNHITHIRVIDVVGSIDSAYATFDSEGRIINDPYPTAFASSGFDLDAVGVMNSATPDAIAGIPVAAWAPYPNPAHAAQTIAFSAADIQYIYLTDLQGAVVAEAKGQDLHGITLPVLCKGIYLVHGLSNRRHFTAKLLVE